MDINALVASHLTATRRPHPPSPAAEERYYRAGGGLPAPRIGVLVSLATAVGMLLLLAGLPGL